MNMPETGAKVLDWGGLTVNAELHKYRKRPTIFSAVLDLGRSRIKSQIGLALEPGVPSLGKLQPNPFGGRFHHKSHIGRLQRETRDQETLAPIRFPHHSETPAAPGNLRKPAIVR